MNEKLAKVKYSLKSHAPEIITVVTTASAFIAYVAYVVKTSTNDGRAVILIDASALNAFEDGSLKEYKTEDEDYTYTITSKNN